MGKIIVQIEYEGAYPILAQDVEWALQAQAPNRKVIVSEIKEQEEPEIKYKKVLLICNNCAYDLPQSGPMCCNCGMEIG